MTRRITAITVVAFSLLFLGTSALRAQEDPIGLGTADVFAVLAGSTITNTGPTTITGAVGLHPGTAVDGFDDVTLDGGLHIADDVADAAKTDLVTAYNEAAGVGPATTVGTELGGETMLEGVYDSASGTFGMTGTLTLDAEGDPDAVFVFQMASTLVTASNSDVELINGANACNVFWQVGSSATLGTGTTFMGNILALTTITLNTGASVEGRVLAQNGAVTLDTNTITQVACQQSPATSTTTTVDDSTTTTVDDSTTTTVDDSATTTTADDSTTTTLDDATATTAGRATTTTADITTNSTFLPPRGGANTGGGSTAGGPNMMLLLGGGALLLVVSTAAFVARRPTQHGSSV